MSYSVFAYAGSIATGGANVAFSPPSGTNWLVKNVAGGLNASGGYAQALLYGIDGYLANFTQQSYGQQSGAVGSGNGDTGGIGQNGQAIIPSGHSLTIGLANTGYPANYNVSGVTI